MNEPKGIEDLASVEEVVAYRGSYADYSAILNRASAQEVRVHWLENLRDDWHWKGSHTDEKHDNGHVQFKRKD